MLPDNIIGSRVEHLERVSRDTGKSTCKVAPSSEEPAGLRRKMETREDTYGANFLNMVFWVLRDLACFGV